jgi:membrane protein YqaA with SNARE-associated domain
MSAVPTPAPGRRRPSSNCEDLLRLQAQEHQRADEAREKAHAQERKSWERSSVRLTLLLRFVLAACLTIVAGVLGVRFWPGWPFH